MDTTKKGKFIKILESEAYGSISKTCGIINCSRQTYYNWKNEDPLFETATQDAISAGKSLLADLAEEALVSRIKAGDTTAIIFTLKNLRKEHYGEKNEKAELEKLVESKENEQAKIHSAKEMFFLTNLRLKYPMASNEEWATPEIKDWIKEMLEVSKKHESDILK